jgi:hypothetical protein
MCNSALSPLCMTSTYRSVKSSPVLFRPLFVARRIPTDVARAKQSASSEASARRAGTKAPIGRHGPRDDVASAPLQVLTGTSVWRVWTRRTHMDTA